MALRMTMRTASQPVSTTSALLARSTTLLFQKTTLHARWLLFRASTLLKGTHHTQIGYLSPFASTSMRTQKPSASFTQLSMMVRTRATSSPALVSALTCHLETRSSTTATFALLVLMAACCTKQFRALQVYAVTLVQS